MQELTPIGCAFLSHAGSLKSGGWASLAGAEPFKFTSVDTLSERGPLWVISSPETAFLLDGGSDRSFLRHAGFLATPVSAIAQELVRENADVALAVQRVSEVMTRVVAMSQLLCADGSGLNPDAHATLVGALQAATAPALRNDDIPAQVLEAMPALLKAPSPMGAPNANDIAVRIPANRLRLAQIVLASAVPAGAWRELRLDEYPSPAMALSAAVGNQMPVFCHVTVRGALKGAKESAPLVRNLTQGATRWMALPEVIALNRLVELTPRRIFLASDYVPAQATLRVPPPVFSPAAGASVSAGLFAEAYMHAACATASLPAEHGRTDAQAYSVRAAWLTAVARGHMMQEAMALSNANFSVIGIGTSHILVSCAKRNLRLLRKAIAASSLLSYPCGIRALEERAAPVRESHELLAEGGA